MGLHIGMLGAKQLLCPLYGDPFGNIHIVATAVVTFARISFRILVGQDTPHSSQNRRRGIILTRDQLDTGELPTPLQLNRLENLRVGQGQKNSRIGLFYPGRKICIIDLI
jgi:hypothetical protein